MNEREKIIQRLNRGQIINAIADLARDDLHCRQALERLAFPAPGADQDLIVADLIRSLSRALDAQNRRVSQLLAERGVPAVLVIHPDAEGVQ